MFIEVVYMRFIDLSGEQFGRLTVIKRVENRGKRTMFLCKCDCGKETIVTQSSLVRGNTQSCGCLWKEKVGKKSITHGMSGTRLHTIWKNLRQRCENKNHKQYSDYGGRGITVCAEWGDFETFYNWAMANGYKDTLSIDRKDNNKGYSPDNCHWTDKYTQARNKRNLVMITYKGKTQCVSAWAEELGIPYEILRLRIQHGWDINKAFTAPFGTKILYTYKGKTLGIAEWEREAGITRGTLWARLQRGWSFERALTTPIKQIKHSQ